MDSNYPYLFVLSTSCGFFQDENSNGGLENASTRLDIGDEKIACSNLRKSLMHIESSTNLQLQADKNRTEKLIREDEAFADAVTEYPDLMTPMLSDSEWSLRATELSKAFWTSAKLAGLDSTLGMKLENASETWNKRRIAHETLPGRTKARLMDEQIKLDMRLSKDTPSIREVCAISQRLLP